MTSSSGTVVEHLPQNKGLSHQPLLTPGANVIKLFLSVIYEFSYKAGVFSRIIWKSLPRTNTLPYYEKP